MKTFIAVLLIFSPLHLSLAQQVINGSSKDNKVNTSPPPAPVNVTTDSATFGADINQKTSSDSIDTNLILDMSDLPLIANFPDKKSSFIENNDSTISAHFTSTTTKPFQNNTGEVELYFDGVYIEYEFEQIGFVEVTGNETSSTKDLLERLKFEAYKRGADAIISIKKQTMLKKEENKQYSVSSFNGVAIKFFTVDDTSDIPATNTPQKLEKKYNPADYFLTVVAGSIFLAVYLWLNRNLDVEEECCY